LPEQFPSMDKAELLLSKKSTANQVYH
jgi:hypothetical protein